MAKSVLTSGVLLGSGAFSDICAIPNFISAEYQAASSFIPDTTSPVLVAFAADWTQGTLTLNFNEPVKSDSLTAAAATLQGTLLGGNSLASYQLTSGTTASVYGLQIVVTLSLVDLNSIKALNTLFTAKADSFISFTSSLIKDLNNNAIVAIASNSGLQASTYQGDTNHPQVQSFDLNINGQYAVITLYFSETVLVSSFQTTGITLQSSSSVSGSTFMVQLSGGAIVSRGNGLVIKIRLLQSDLDSLKLRGVGTSIATSWLTLSTNTVFNVAGVNVVALANGINALSVSNYTPDTTAPSAIFFSLNMNTGTFYSFYLRKILTLHQEQ